MTHTYIKLVLISSIVLLSVLNIEAADERIEIGNCGAEDDAKNLNLAPKQGFILFARSTKQYLHAKDTWVPDNYDVSYKMYQVDGVNLTIKVTQWLSRGNTFLSIPPYGLLPGHYHIHPEVKPKAPGLPKFNAAYHLCHLFYEAKKPIVIISGGSYKMVPSHTEIVLSGEESVDVNLATTRNQGFQYYWICKQSKSNFCDKTPVSTEMKFSIPRKYVEAGDKFEITLKVTTHKHNKGSYVNSASTTQTIEVVNNAAQLEIVCRRNCPPVSEAAIPTSPTYLAVSCSQRCETLKDEDYEWTVTSKNDPDFKFDYKKNTQFGQNTNKFIILKDVLVPEEYLFEVRLRDTVPLKGRAVMNLRFPAPPKVTTCRVTPNQGTVATRFTLLCGPENATSLNIYEIYSRDKKDHSKTDLNAFGVVPSIFQQHFLLPNSDQNIFFVKVITEQGTWTEVPISATVESTISNQSTHGFIDSAKKFYGDPSNPNSVTQVIGSDNADTRSKALQKFKAVVNEVVKKKFKDEDEELKDFVQDLKFRVVEDMLHAPVDTINEVVQMSESIAKLLNHNDLSPSDPLLGKFTTTICKKMMNKHVELVRKEKYPLNLGEKTNRVSSSLESCLETNTNPNYYVVKPIDHNVTTPVPIFNEPIVTENYPDYADFSDEYYQNLEYLKESTYNIINATSLSAKVIAMTTAVGEQFVETFGNKSGTIVAKDTGRLLAKSRVRSQGVVLIPSRDFVDDEHPYDILLSTWSKDIMWWNPKYTKIATDIAHIEFWHSTCKEKVTTFKNSVGLFFTVNKDKGLNISLIRDTFVVPEAYTSLSNDDLNKVIKVRRMDFPAGKLISIDFSNIEDSAILDIVVTQFKFPAIEDFDNKTTSKNVTVGFTLVNENDYDIWCYVGVLANREIQTNNSLQSITYDISFVVSLCVRWVELNHSWTPTCKIGDKGNVSTIHCECNTFSVIAGYVQNMRSLLQEVATLELELELQSNYVIIITVAVMLALYSILLIVILKRRSEVYFLGDNVSTDQFAYVVVVKTGFGRYTSTTSNVIIRLIGSNDSSTPHVLNFPDPQLRILQKFGNDLFILTTENHLGEITEIELWFDSVGANPDWYCRDILVYDMQEHVEWYFVVKKRLTVVRGKTHISLKPTKTEVKGKKTLFRKIRFRNLYHTWYLWQDEENFSYVKKLTVILSCLLTTYALVLLFSGVPTFQLLDGFDNNTYKLDEVTVLIAFISSLLGFIIHTAIAWCFRLSKLQYSSYNDEEKWSFNVTQTCWLVLVLLIISSSSLLIISGFWVPFYQSLIWLTTCLMGTILQILVYENIFAVIATLLCKVELAYNIKRRFTNLLVSTEEQRRYLYQQFGEGLLRPYFEHLYNPLKKTEVKEKQTEVRRRRDVISEFEDLIMFGIYVFILYAVVLVNKGGLLIRSKLVMEEMMQGKLVRNFAFDEMQTIQEVYNFINTTFIPSTHPVRWYGNFVVSEPALMIDMTNKYIGVARIRQQRIKANVCKMPKQMEFLNTSCEPELALHYGDTKPFGYAWGKYSFYLEFDRLKDIWKYDPEYKTGTFGYIGEFATYSGGGYVSYLGRTLYNSYANFRKFLQKIWIDNRTRSIFIEILTYNANYNVFNSIRLLFEQSATGSVFQSINVFAVRMLFVQNEAEHITKICFVLFVVWVTMLFFKHSLGAIKRIRTFYKDIWFIIDLIIILMSLVCIGLFILRINLIGQYLSTLEHVKHNEFLNYFYLFYLEEFLKIFASVLVCLATVRLWKFLRFGLMFRVLERTLAISAEPLLTFTVAYGVLAVAYATTIVILYGNYFKEINTVVRLLRLLVTMALKSSELELSKYVHLVSATFYFTTYGILVKVVFLIYIMLILMAYSEAQMEFSTHRAEYNIKHYILERIKYIPKFLKYKYARLKAGQTKKPKIEPKADKFVYSNSFLVETRKMLTMKCMTQCCIRNMLQPVSKSKHLSDNDVRLMLRIAQLLLEKTHNVEVEVFFKGKIKGKRIALVDERRVTKIAEVTNMLLETQKHETVAEKGVVLDKYVQMIRKKQKTLKNCSLTLKLMIHKMNTFDLELSKFK